MKLNRSKFARAIFSLVILVGCSTPNRAVSSSDAESDSPALAGEWSSQCYALPKRHSIIFQASFSNGKMLAKGLQFADGACQNFNLTMSLQSKYSIGKKSGDGYEINFIPDSISIEIFNPDALKYYRLKKSCGISNWVLNQKIELIDRNCEPTVIPPSLQKDGEDIFRAVNNELLFGNFPFGFSETRPTQLSHILPLKRMSSEVAQDLEVYQKYVAELNSKFNQLPENPNDKIWVQAKISHMVDIDQYVRNYFFKTPVEHNYSEAEKTDFFKLLGIEMHAVDLLNTADLKKLLKVYPWFTISSFGKDTDNEAWLLVQHADQDSQFQKDILKILGELWPKAETKPANYALLYDRIVFAPDHPNDRKPQRYGTQGTCVNAKWQAYQSEDPAHLDDRRATVGLGPEADYAKQMNDLGFCKGFK